MGFVVEKIPFGGEVVGGGASPIIRIGKSFDAGAEERVFFPEVDSAGPDDLADVLGRSDI